MRGKLEKRGFMVLLSTIIPVLMLSLNVTPVRAEAPKDPVVSDPDGTVVTYTVEFYVFDELVDKQTVSAGNAVNPPQVATVSTNEAEYHFIRWVCQTDGTEPDLNRINSDLILVAEFERIPYDEDTGDAPVRKQPKKTTKPTTETDEEENVETNSSSESSAAVSFPALNIPVVRQKEPRIYPIMEASLRTSAPAAALKPEKIKEKEVSESTGETEEASEEPAEEDEALKRIKEEEVPLAAPDAEPFPFWQLFLPALLTAGAVAVSRVLRAKKAGGTFED